MKIVAFGASASKNSINRQLAHFAARQFEHADLELLDLTDFPLPLYTIDTEMNSGFPENVGRFLEHLRSADLIIISMAEHNGSYTAAFKSLFDWLSRMELKMFNNKKMFLLSTSPGQRGGMSSLETAKSRFPKHGADIIADFSLPRFHENFDPIQGIINPELKSIFDEKISLVKGLDW
jgi:NAD(P)H-dependent FMN reductase